LREISIELSENQEGMLDFLLEIQDGELTEAEFVSLIFMSGLCLLFDQFASETFRLLLGAKREESATSSEPRFHTDIAKGLNEYDDEYDDECEDE